VEGTAPLHGSEHCWPGARGEVPGQHRINMFELTIGVKGVNHGVDLLRIDRDTCDAGASIVV